MKKLHTSHKRDATAPLPADSHKFKSKSLLYKISYFFYLSYTCRQIDHLSLNKVKFTLADVYLQAVASIA